MYFVERDSSGQITCLHNQSNERAQEALEANHPDLVAFFQDYDGTLAGQLLLSDLQFIRVIEDLLDVLFAKNLIQITDFNPAVIRKLVARRGVRQRLVQFSGIMNPDDPNIPM